MNMRTLLFSQIRAIPRCLLPAAKARTVYSCSGIFPTNMIFRDNKSNPKNSIFL